MAASVRFGVDLDGVVADFVSGWVNRYNAEFGAKLDPDDATEWHAAARMTHFGSTGEFWTWARHAGEGGRSLFRSLPTYPGAVAGLRQLLRLAHVVVLTTKPQWAVSDTLSWLGDLALPLREVHIVSDKTAVCCDVYLEDSPLHLEALRHTHPEAVVCRWVRPWNRPVPGCLDVESWEDVHVVAREVAARR